jgi:hypothetical protein
MVNFQSDKKLYHGINSFVLINFINEFDSDQNDIGVSFVDKWELSKNIDVESRSAIGMYGEPLILYAKRAEYMGSIKKYTDDNLIRRGRTSTDDFFTSLLRLDGRGSNAEGLINTFNLTFYSINNAGQKIVTKANRCVLEGIKRGIKKDGFMADEISFKFHSIDQKIEDEYDIEKYDPLDDIVNRIR